MKKSSDILIVHWLPGIMHGRCLLLMQRGVFAITSTPLSAPERRNAEHHYDSGVGHL